MLVTSATGHNIATFLSFFPDVIEDPNFRCRQITSARLDFEEIACHPFYDRDVYLQLYIHEPSYFNRKLLRFAIELKSVNRTSDCAASP